MILSSFCWWIIQHPERLDEIPTDWGYPENVSSRLASSNRTGVVSPLSEDISLSQQHWILFKFSVSRQR